MRSLSTPDSVKYYHWASNPVKLRKMNYPQSGHPKPNGLWFDINGDWKRMCEAAQFGLENLRYRHKVTILDTSRLLFLKSARDIDTFTRKYEHNLSSHIQPLQSAENLDAFAGEYGQNFWGDILNAFSSYIMWEEVAEKHSGIIIFPYSRTRSRKYLWYWGWNCASGCVWDTSVIRMGKPCRMANNAFGLTA